MTELPDTEPDPNEGQPPDIGDVGGHDWPWREMGAFAGRREPRFQVVYKQSVQDQIHLHGQGSSEIEVCGVLVGRGFRDANGPYLLVEHAINGNGATSRSTNVTFTAETWAHIHDTMDREYRDKKILGWYHTHPGFGIFLSDMDIFICANFFNLPWQVAFVYDPVSGEEGNFVWRTGRPEPDAVLVEDDVTPLAAAVPLIDKRDMPTSDAPVDIPARPIMNARQQDGFGAPMVTHPTGIELGDRRDAFIVELMERMRRTERRLKFAMVGLIFVIAFVCAWAYEFYPLPVIEPIRPLAPATMRAAPARGVPAPSQRDLNRRNAEAQRRAE